MSTNEQRITQHFETLAKFTATPGAGVTRLSYSPEDILARDYIKQQMANSGLAVYEDAIGNIYGRLDGVDNTLPPVMIGSHFDSVPNGGAFDGTAGVVMGLEVAALFHEQNLQPHCPLEIVALIEEEGSSFGSGLLASRAIAGLVSTADLENMHDSQGVSAADKMAKVGFDASQVNSIVRKPGDLKAFIELHIEQGPILEQAEEDIGIVDTIVGLSQLSVTITGKAGHAGTTPMNMRADALLVSSQLISQIAQFAIEEGETVATVGKLNVFPNGSNVIPSKVIFSIDVRSKLLDKLARVVTRIEETINAVNSPQYTADVERLIYIHPVDLDKSIFSNLSESSKKAGYKTRTMVSGAGHDAMIFAQICPVGLVFVPSKDGLSHHPDEWTDYDQIAKGINVVFETVKNLTGVA